MNMVSVIESPMVLPPFYRKVWVSDEARNVWERRIAEYCESWRQIEWLTVINGLRRCAMVSVSQQEFAKLSAEAVKFGIRTTSLGCRIRRIDGKDVLVYRVALGKKMDLTQLRRAWNAGDNLKVGELLGYPDCCCRRFDSIFVKDRLIDFVWSIAVQDMSGVTLEGQREFSSCKELNIFWRSEGVRLVPHIPCSFSCQSSLAFARRLLTLASELGYLSHLKFGLDILSWPVEWTSLHGIAQTRTPIMKISQRTDMADGKRCVRLRSTSYPTEGARGLEGILGATHATGSSLQGTGKVSG
jgi:hypothetical protein